MKKSNVLLVDDQIANLIALEQVLEPLEVNILKANSGNEALTWLLKEPVDCALIDVSMPGMDGLELLKIINRDPQFSIIPVLLVTGKIFSDNELLKGFQLGAVDYLYKPVDPIIVTRKVRFYVQNLQNFRRISSLADKLDEMDETLIKTARRISEKSGASIQADAKLLESNLTELQKLWKDVSNDG